MIDYLIKKKEFIAELMIPEIVFHAFTIFLLIAEKIFRNYFKKCCAS